MHGRPPTALILIVLLASSACRPSKSDTDNATSRADTDSPPAQRSVTPPESLSASGSAPDELSRDRRASMAEVPPAGENTATDDPAVADTAVRDNTSSLHFAAPDEAVRAFLTALKVGDSQRATRMLSDRAREEMLRASAVIQPPGSPTAQFAVGEVKLVGDKQRGAHVVSTWTDNDPLGAPQSYEIIWILRREPDGWAIAGMATEVFDDQEPLVLNFENPLDAQRKRQAVDQELARRERDRGVRQARQPDAPVPY